MKTEQSGRDTLWIVTGAQLVDSVWLYIELALVRHMRFRAGVPSAHE